MAEARDEHAEVKTLLQEIEQLASDVEGFDSTLTELIDSVEHHIEGDMFVKVRELFNDEALEKLGKELQMTKGKQHREAELNATTE